MTYDWLEQFGREYTWRENQQLAAILFLSDTHLVRHTKKCDETHEFGYFAVLRMRDTSKPLTDLVSWKRKAQEVAANTQMLQIYDKLIQSSPWKLTNDQQLKLEF